MNPKDISESKNPDLRNSLVALQRAAQDARRIAIQTNTAIIVVRNGKRIRLTADDLRKEQEAANRAAKR